MKIRKITTAAMFVAIGVITSNILFIPVGASKCFPIQHMINVLSAAILGPGYGVMIAFVISLLRNMLGLGTLLAFPGSMIGALVSGILFSRIKTVSAAALGEVIGTGILGALAAFPIAKFILGKEVAALFFMTPFLISSIGGTLIACCLIKGLKFVFARYRVMNN